MAKAGNIPWVRRIAGLEALDEAVGRAAETGRPIFYTTGYWGLDSQFGVMNMAGLNIMGHVAKLAGQYGAEMMYFANKSHMVPIALDLIESGYREGGRPELFKPDMVRYVSDDQIALQSYIMSWIFEERPSVVMQMGAIYAEAINVMAAGARVEALQMGGSALFWLQAQYALVCDYQLYGDEIYCAGAILSGDPAQLGQIRGRDWELLIIVLLALISAIMANAGLNYAGLVGW
jgi:hypothetical protein